MTTIDVVTLLALIPWSIYLILFGVPELHKILGGSFALIVLYPVVILAQVKYKEYRSVAWMFLLTLIGLIAVNHIYSFLLVHPLHLELAGYCILFGTILGTTLALVIVGYMGSCDGFVEWEKRQNHEIYKKYVMFNGQIGAIYMALSILPSPFIWSKAGNYMLSIKSGLWCVMVFGVVMLITTRKVTIEEIEYFAKPINRIELNLDKVKKYLFVGIIIFVLNSALLEISRGQWLLWSETIILFAIYISLQFRFAKIMFLPKPVEITKPALYNFPTLNNKIATTVVLASFVICIGLLITVIV